MPRPKPKKLGDPNRAKVRGFQGATAEVMRAINLDRKTPAGGSDRSVSYEAAAVRASITAQMCPFCGRGPYKVVAVHTNKAHGIDKWELRNIAGLTSNDSICAPEYADRARELAVNRKLHEYGPKTRKNGRKPQRRTAAGLERNRQTIIRVNEHATAEQRLAAGRKAGETKRAAPTCAAGHAWDETNTRLAADGSRCCRACEKARSRERQGFDGGGEAVSAQGTIRRLQALACIGYSIREQARRIGKSEWWASDIVKRVAGGGVIRSTADAVATMYEELSAIPAPPTRATKATATTARNRGWLPPSAWADQDIDHVPEVVQ